MLRFLKGLTFGLLTLCLFSCSHIYGKQGFVKNRDNDYLSAQSIEPLKIPAGYSSQGFVSEYPVSSKSYPLNSAKVDLTPPELNAK